MVQCKPAVHHLPVHLFEEQNVTYEPDVRSRKDVLKNTNIQCSPNILQQTSFMVKQLLQLSMKSFFLNLCGNKKKSLDRKMLSNARPRSCSKNDFTPP